MAGLKLANDVSYVVDGKEAVVLQWRTGRYFGLNRSATEALSLLLAESKSDAILQYQRRYELTRYRAEADVEELIRSLLHRGIVRYE